MGPCTASHCCCLHRHTLPCATFRSPHTAAGFHFVIGCCYGLPFAAARPRNLPWAPYRSSCCCQAVICHGPCCACWHYSAHSDAPSTPAYSSS
ncbi:unnamed protein product, partial [Staurois parvus]